MRLDPLPKKKKPITDPAKLFVAGKKIAEGSLEEMSALFENEIRSHKSQVEIKTPDYSKDQGDFKNPWDSWKTVRKRQVIDAPAKDSP